ncbi:MAG: methyltransferase domain-containing protein [Burkholderiales bacterium]|nr:methyltransferase domain-containing protein [Burkholderiales bacterium]
MTLTHSYKLIAPFYDAAVARLSAPARRASLANIPSPAGLDILIDGVGTGLDLPLLPAAHRYVGTDLVAAMLRRARARCAGLDCRLLQADSLALPFAANSFDVVVLHLIVAVVPRPELALAEAARVARPGARLLVLDKFLRTGSSAPLRRLLSPLAGRLATRLDVVFEEVLAQVPALVVKSDRPVLASGWFRSIVLEKRAR